LQALLPGRYRCVQRGTEGEPARVHERTYWEMDFPDRGAEEEGDPRGLVDEFESRMVRAVNRRLRSDVPVAAYLSGGDGRPASPDRTPRPWSGGRGGASEVRAGHESTAGPHRPSRVHRSGSMSLARKITEVPSRPHLSIDTW
jgi:hypothetical protein